MRIFVALCVSAFTAVYSAPTWLGADVPNYQGCQTPTARSMSYCDLRLTHEQRAASLVASLSLNEKISRMYGCRTNCDTCPCAVDRVGLPSYAYLLEANTAVAAVCLGPERCATVFPGPMGLASSFNRTMWFQKGQVISTEVRAFANHGGKRGLGKLTGIAGYGPNINIARDPRFGRSGELPGEDPMLSGTYATHMMKGMQEADSKGYPRMIAYLKHFTAYSRETNRGHDTYNISQYDFFDSYLPQYEMAMKEGNASGVMCSYNAENGVPSCVNGWLLNTILRDKWSRPDAVVTTDGGALKNLRGPPMNVTTDEEASALALNNGVDINDGQEWQHLGDAIRQGKTTEALVDQSLIRSLTQLFKAGLFDPVSNVSWSSIPKEAINSTKHQGISHDAALQSMVLLRNENGILPLTKGRRIAVVGPQADARSGLLSDYASEQACADGTDNCIISIADAVRKLNGDSSLTTTAAGVDIDSEDKSGIPAALELVRSADVVVLAVGIDKTVEHEGIDRTDIGLPGAQEYFAKKVMEVGKPVVMVMVNGGAVSVELIPMPDGIVEAFNPCTTGAAALAQLLFGEENRWGKLPVTIYPKNYTTQQDLANYDMTIFPGRTYRYYQGTPLWSFGTGLSLTEFEMDCTPPVSGLGSYSCQVNNTGGLDGDEVVMVFHRPSDQVRQLAQHPLPIKRLIAFERVHVPKQSTGDVHIEISPDLLQLVTDTGDSVLYNGTHDIVFWRGQGRERVFTITV